MTSISLFFATPVMTIYQTLSLSLRKKLRGVSRIIPIDLVPIAMPCDSSAAFMQEINKGDVVHEKN